MDDFQTVYLSSCTQLNIEPLNSVMNMSLHDKPGSLCTTLSLSGLSLPLKACAALSAALAQDHHFTKLILADAFLGDDGCITLANALKSNSTLLHLDMRGNSIRADGAISIGQMLRVNTKLKHLTLEWNCVGIWESGIRALADGLSMNQKLTFLDLRNNKIGPQGAQALALSLKHNTTLVNLDLRWNNAGLIGGRAFVDLLKWNHVIKNLDLTGNEVPEDLASSVSAALERNRDRSIHEAQAKQHSETLSSTLQTLSVSHQDALGRLSAKLANTDTRASSLSDKLELASGEIYLTQETLLKTQARLDIALSEKKEFEDAIIKERSATQKQIAELQQELVHERQVPINN